MDDQEVFLRVEPARAAEVGAPDFWPMTSDIELAESDSLDFTCPVAVRMSADGLQLQARLAPDALNAPSEMLVALVQEQCAGLGAQVPCAESDVRGYLRRCREEEWTTIATGTPPVQPADGGVDLLVALSSASDAPSGGRARCAVRAGTPLATLRQGRPGAPGRDLRGRAIPVRAPRAGRLPRGANTYVADDGVTLVAACDGEAALRHLLIHVAPARVVDADALDPRRVMECDGDLFIRGTVGEGCRVDAIGDVYVDGHVREARITSAMGGVTVSGSVAGERGHHAELRAATTVSCGAALHATLRAGRDVYLDEARYSVVDAAGNLHLSGTIEDGLHDVDVRLGGGILCAAPPPSPIPAPTERQYLRVPTGISAALALGGPSFTFTPCRIDDLSEGGARCRLTGLEGLEAPALGSVIHLRFGLPGRATDIYAVARVVRYAGSRTIGVAFADLMQADRARIAEYCLDRAGFYPAALSATSADRRG